jgi:hypothetical protein
VSERSDFGKQTVGGAIFAVQPGREAEPLPTVFLSYARKDDGDDYDDADKSLLRRLTRDLTAAGFAVWWDRVTLPARSLAFTAEIERAITRSDRFVLIAGPGAAKSDYVGAELRCAERLCKPLTAILRAGDYAHIPASIADVNAIDFRPPRAYESALDDLIARLRDPASVGALLGTSWKPLPNFFLERPTPYNAARAALLADAASPAVISAPPKATAVYGQGGIGKSTLAAALAHDCTIRRTFTDGIIWLEVGQTPSPAALQATIGATVFGDSRENYNTEQDGRVALAKLLRGKQALIVLDDVWDHHVIRHFPIEDTQCRLLITTRSGALAGRVQGADIRLDVLTEDEGAALLAGIAGGSADDPTYKQISRELGGHMLALDLAARQLVNR